MDEKAINDDVCKRLDNFACELLNEAQKQAHPINDYFMASTMVMTIYTQMKMKQARADNKRSEHSAESQS